LNSPIRPVLRGLGEGGNPPSFAEPAEGGQSAIRNPQSAIRNPQSAIRNPQSAIRNHPAAIPLRFTLSPIHFIAISH
jgi:major type 1 subunit fimbrin (pilin)